MKHSVLGILANVDSGKTTLSEGLLFESGAIQKIGRVDNQDAFLDTYELERARGITIFSKQAVFTAGDYRITLLDTPGHVDFSAEMERTLQVLDYAVLLVSGADGVQGHTETLWRLLKKYQVPVFIFVNKMDQLGTDKETLLQELKERLSSAVTDFTEYGTEEFFENAALSEEKLLEDFLKEGLIPDEEIARVIRERKLYPCYFGSALKLRGVREFLEGLQKWMLPTEPKKEFGAKVFKIARDEQGNRLTYLKITGGSLKVRTEIHEKMTGLSSQANQEASDRNTEVTEKINQIRIYSGTKYDTVNDVEAGMICAVTGLSYTYPGQGLGCEKESDSPLLEPVLTYQILLPEKCDAAVILPKLRQLEEEEPQLHIVWNEELKELQAALMGEVQIEILKHLIQERFGISVEFGPGHIVYHETIENCVEGVGHFEPLRHYAEVHLLLEPGEAGSGIQVAADCSEDILDKNWQRLILTHLTEREFKGVLTGSVITDMKITLVTGKAHLKHTEGGDFRQATYRAVRQGLMQAKSLLLEPYFSFRLEIPEQSVGRAMTDLNEKKAQFKGPEVEGRMSVLTGRAPVSTIQGYQKEVTAYTRGLGHLFCSYAGYGPCHNAEEVIEQIGYEAERDLRNTADSVFCAHGAGFVVPWYEVSEYMHLESVLGGGGKKQTLEEEAENIRKAAMRREAEIKRSSGSTWIGVEEVDAILNQSGGANRKADLQRKFQYKKVVEAPVTRVYKPQEQKEKYMLVDGYNVIFAWKELKELAKVNIDGARGRLIDILCNYQAMKKYHLMVVFDAYRVSGHQTEVLSYHNIQVVYTKEAETADRYIEKFAHDNGKKYDVTVVTSDGVEQIIITGQGCTLISAREFEQEVMLLEKSLRDYQN